MNNDVIIIKNDNSFDFIKKVNIGDYVIYSPYGSTREGIVKEINHRGINISTSCGDRFYKWCHIKEIHKNKGKQNG